MRRLLPALSIAAAATLAAPYHSVAGEHRNYSAGAYVAPVTGAAVGTVVGVGLYNGWFGTSAAVTALPATAAGATAVGGVAGIGTIALIDSVVQPCRGFQALLGMNRDQCVNGEYVGYGPGRSMRRMSMR